MNAIASNLVILLSDVRYRFPGNDNLSLRVDELAITEAEHTAITGPSGCGKTTLLRLIAGVLVPQRGTVRTLGEATSSMNARSRGKQRIRSIGMVFQEFALLDYLSALENIMLTARLGGFDSSVSRSHALELAKRAGIEHVLHRHPAQLSQGERQRVAVCRALVTSPRLVICDEPTGNLDPNRSREVIDLIITEANRIGSTVITVTHDHSVLSRFRHTTDFSQIASLDGGSA